MTMARSRLILKVFRVFGFLAVAGVVFSAFVGTGFRGAVVRADTPALTGTFWGNDNGIYYLQQIGNQVWWVGESVDPDQNPQGGLLGPGHVWSRGLDSTSVFEGTISGSTLSGRWVEVSRGQSLGTGSISMTIDTVTDANGMHAHLVLAGGTFRATEWTQGDVVSDAVYQYPDGHFELLEFYDRFQQGKKSLAASNNDDNGDRLGDTHNPEELRPYRDQTVFYGEFVTRNATNDEVPHVNLSPTAARDYGNFACHANDGDLDFRIRVDASRLPTDFPSTTLSASSPGLGWGTVNAADEDESGYDHRDIIPKLPNIGSFNTDLGKALQVSVPGNNSYIGAEGVMYAGNKVKGCPSSAPLLLPGWAADGGNSILVNSRPINGNSSPDNLMQATDPCRSVGSSQMALTALNGNAIIAADPSNSKAGCNVPDGYGTQVRVTGALILDCGHSDVDDLDTNYFTPTDALHTCDQGEAWEDDDDQNQEIHPFYSLDLIECPLGNYPDDACPGKTVRPNLTGAWGSEDGGTYYVRQMGNTIWWLGLTRNRAPIMPAPAVQIPNPTNVFQGTLTTQSDGSAVITGAAVTTPKGLETGGDSTTATFTVSSNHKHFDLASSSNGAFPLPSHFDKLYEPQEDTTPPTSTLAIGSPQYQAGTASPLYVTSTTELTIDASDAGQGVQTLWYRYFPQGTTPPVYTPIVLDQPAANAQGSFTISGTDGPYEVDTYATDASGNDESPHVQMVSLDNTAPSITINQPTASAYPHSASITLDYSATDAGSGVQSIIATLDGSSTTSTGKSLASGQVINLLTDVTLGSHTFTVTATDNVTNTAAQSVVFSVIVTADSIKADVDQFLASGKIDSQGLATALLAKLDAAAAARARGDCTTANNDYQAFINEVMAQAGKGIDPTAAQILIADANYLMTHCP